MLGLPLSLIPFCSFLCVGGSSPPCSQGIFCRNHQPLLYKITLTRCPKASFKDEVWQKSDLLGAINCPAKSPQCFGISLIRRNQPPGYLECVTLSDPLLIVII